MLSLASISKEEEEGEDEEGREEGVSCTPPSGAEEEEDEEGREEGPE
jgi:hypothetical protein